MKRGVILGFDGNQPGSFLQDAGGLMEELGFDALWVPEHVLFFPEYDPQYPYADDGRLRGNPKGVMDPFAVLTYLAATTSKIRLATGICIVPQRHPAYLAKAVADLDRLSDGRFDFGVGVGWQREEYEALGIPFEERGKRMDEALDAMKALWAEDVTTYEGQFVHLKQVWSHPKPLQSPHPPILVGGESPAALRRVATHGDGWYAFEVTPKSCAQHLETISAGLDSVRATLGDRRVVATPAQECRNARSVREFESLGVDQVIAPIGALDIETLRTRALKALDWMG